VCKIGDPVHVCAKLNNAGVYCTYFNVREGILSKSCMSPGPSDICISSDTLCVININLLIFLMLYGFSLLFFCCVLCCILTF